VEEEGEDVEREGMIDSEGEDSNECEFELALEVGKEKPEEGLEARPLPIDENVVQSDDDGTGWAEGVLGSPW